MKLQVSILIPVYNAVCLPLVKTLHKQAKNVSELEFEIIVAEDGSNCEDAIKENSRINELCNCRHIVRHENVGRAEIRNFLAQNARYPWLLFVDCDCIPASPEYLSRYLNTADNQLAVYGGNSVGNDIAPQGCELRFRYERKAERKHTMEYRQKNANLVFTTSNFMVKRSVMLSHPFDNRFKTYGYEDVFFSKNIEKAGVIMSHINNPVLLGSYESNARFIEKTEESLHTLYMFRVELSSFSPIIRWANRLQSLHLSAPARLLFKVFRGCIRRNLYSNHPSLFLFKAYKLGVYLCK